MLLKAFVSVAIPFGAVSIKTIFLIFFLSSIDLRVRLKYTFNTTKNATFEINLNVKIKTFINEFNKTANGNKELKREKNCCALLQIIFYKKMQKQVAHF